ncbi:ribonuclease H-like domain-containing protein [Tanacetum coccineum]
MVNATKDNFDEDDLVKFQELLLDAEKPLYERCPDFTKLSAIVKLLNLKDKYGASDKFFTELLGLIKKMLPADEKFPKIAKDPRNLRLAISVDGVDVNTGNRHHSVWPVLTVIYNLPPWLCMKRKFIMLSVLILGYPRNDIDVFLEPLVDDLHTLFETGVDTYDVSTKNNFTLRADVLWTINDYPALGTLCGCPYSGFKGCVVCGKDTNCVRLSPLSKQSYVGHRRYLPYNHLFKKQKKAFNGQQEFLPALIPMIEEQIYNEIQKQKRNTTEEEGRSSQVNGQNDAYWKKFNIWYRKLSFWRHNSVPYCIDFMHVEKNVAKNLQEEPAPTGDQSGPSAPPVPKTAKQLAAKRNQERGKSIMLLAIPDEYLLKFHNVPDAKSLWEAIKSRFGGNEESKKMQKNVLKHHFENFTTAPNESLDKAYDRFQKLISQLEVYAAPVSKEDINQKFLRSLPPFWSQIALIMRNKPDIDQTDIDDLYNNLRVYEDEIKRSSSSTSNSQNLAFLSSENTSRTNEVSNASGDFRVSTAGGTSQVSSTLCADEVMCSFFAQQTTSTQLKNKDLQQIDEDDLEELDLRWPVAMLTVRVKKFIQKTRRNLDFQGKKPVSLDKSKVECYNCHRKGHFARKCNSGRNQGKRPYGDNGRRNASTNEPSSQALVTQYGLGGYDWSHDFDEPVNYALMDISSSSSSSSSDNEVQNYSKQCLESFKTLQKNYDSEREKHNRARLEIQGYELALESLEYRILGHEKNELA